MHRMRHSLHALVGIGFAIGAVACAPPSPERMLQDPPGPKRVDVTRSLELHFVAFAPDEARIARHQRRDLLAFLREIDAGQRDPIAVLNDDRMPANLARERRKNVRALLEKQGFDAVSNQPAKPIQTSWSESSARNSILVQVLHYSAQTHGCPDFSRPRIGGFENYTSSNFGCATAQNLEAMVAEPRDLEHGRDPGAADGPRMGQSIKRYREDEVKSIGEDDAAAPATTDE